MNILTILLNICHKNGFKSNTNSKLVVCNKILVCHRIN